VIVLTAGPAPGALCHREASVTGTPSPPTLAPKRLVDKGIIFAVRKGDLDE
jgi:hypothetical protein